MYSILVKCVLQAYCGPFSLAYTYTHTRVSLEKQVKYLLGSYV